MAQLALVSNFNNLDSKYKFNLSNTKEIYNELNTKDKYEGIDALDKYLTMGFRQVLYKVISEIYEFPVQATQTITQNNVEFIVKQVFLIVSNDTKMDAMENNDYFLVIILESKLPIDSQKVVSIDFSHKIDQEELRNIFLKIDVTNNSQRQNNILDFISKTCRTEDLKNLLSNLSTQNPDIRQMQIPQKLIDLHFEKTTLLISILFSFYYYGFMIANRFSRRQADISIDINNSNFNTTSNEFIKHRIILINMKRFFLIDNRSKNPIVKDLCIQLVEKEFRIDAKYLNYIDMLNSFEKLIETIAENKQVASNKKMNTSLAIVAFLGLPIAIIGLLYQINGNSDIIKHTFRDFFYNGNLLYVISLSAMPFLLITFTILLFNNIKKLFNFIKK